MSEFNPDLFVSQGFSFEETTVLMLDELSQARIIDENLRRCFALRVASRILMLIYMTGENSENNNFIVNMDFVTKRISEIFDVFYDFLKPNNRTEDFHHVIAIMNNSIIDFITEEYRIFILAKSKGETYTFLSKDKVDNMLNNILVAQKFTFYTEDVDNSVALGDTKIDFDSVKKACCLRAWVKLYAVLRTHDLINQFLSLLVRESEAMLGESAGTTTTSVVHTYYTTNLELLIEIIKNKKNKKKDDALMQDDFFSLVSSEFSNSISKMLEHVRFLIKVHQESVGDGQDEN